MKKFSIVLSLLFITMPLIACEQLEGEAANRVEQAVEEQFNEMKEEMGEAVKEAVKDAAQAELDAIAKGASELVNEFETSIGLKGELVTVNIYYPDDQVEYFIEEEIEVATTGMWIQDAMKALDTKGILPEGIHVIDSYEEEGIMNVQFSEELETFITTMGTSGEYMWLGSIVNTLLDAGDLEQIMLRVGDDYLETGHNVYDIPFVRYEDNVAVQ